MLLSYEFPPTFYLFDPNYLLKFIYHVRWSGRSIWTERCGVASKKLQGGLQFRRNITAYQFNSLSMEEAQEQDSSFEELAMSSFHELQKWNEENLSSSDLQV